MEDCDSNLTAPSNGMVSVNGGGEFGSLAKYSCDGNSIAVGTIVRVCQANGIWSGLEPVCNCKCAHVKI